MKKSILFAGMAMLVYLISTSLIGVWAKQLHLIHDDEKTSIPFTEKFHHVSISANVEGYCQLNIKEGNHPELSFGKSSNDGKKPEFYIKNDTLYLNLVGRDIKSYNYLDIKTGPLSSITAVGNKNLILYVEMDGSQKELILSGPLSLSVGSSRIDTLNIHSENKTQISIDTSNIKQLNLFHKKGEVIDFNIGRTPMPEIRQFDKALVPDSL